MSLKHLQEKVGVTADGAFGPGTLKAAIAHYKMTPVRAAHFFAQCAHESGGFKAFNENLNYGAKGLLGIFKKYFPDAGTAAKYERKPEMIANRVYANRMGNGDEKSGDGWKFRGRGAIQLTGKNNYLAFSKYISDPEVMTNPDIVATKYSFESAMFFFETNGLWAICDKGVDDATILALTKRINGGTHGLDDRKEKTKKYAVMLGVIKS
jgi:putative chitinase